MRLSDQERAMLDGRHGEALRRSMEGLIQLGEAFGAEDMVRIGYAHVHPEMALYVQDVELLEELVRLGAKVSVPTSANVTNVDSDNWKLTGAHPRFGYHLDENRVGSHLVRVEALLENVSDFTCLGFHVGKIVGTQVPVFTGFTRRPTLDELDGLGAGLATTGSVSMFIVPQITPPFATVGQAFKGRPPVQDLVVR